MPHSSQGIAVNPRLLWRKLSQLSCWFAKGECYLVRTLIPPRSELAFGFHVNVENNVSGRGCEATSQCERSIPVRLRSYGRFPTILQPAKASRVLILNDRFPIRHATDELLLITACREQAECRDPSYLCEAKTFRLVKQ